MFQIPLLSPCHQRRDPLFPYPHGNILLVGERRESFHYPRSQFTRIMILCNSIGNTRLEFYNCPQILTFTPPLNVFPTLFAPVIAVGFPILFFFIWGEPYQRGFFCDDESLRHPFHESTVRNWMLYIIGLILPIGTVSGMPLSRL